MDITPTPMGAVADVTDDAVAQVLEMLADALHKDPMHTELLLFGLRDAAETRGRFLDRQAVGKVVSPEILAEVSQELDTARDALQGLLAGRGVVQMPAGDCLYKAEALRRAGEAARKRWWTPGQPKVWLPGQQEQGQEDAA